MAKRTRTGPKPNATGTALARWLHRRSISQSQLAREIGCSPSMISYLANGKRIPAGQILRALARRTRIGLDELLGIR